MTGGPLRFVPLPSVESAHASQRNSQKSVDRSNVCCAIEFDSQQPQRDMPFWFRMSDVLCHLCVRRIKAVETGNRGGHGDVPKTDVVLEKAVVV